jgi:hypothetical protein
MVNADVCYSCMFIGWFTIGMHFIVYNVTMCVPIKSYEIIIMVQDRLRVYKETWNRMLGVDYSTKLSPWLAHGCITPKTIHDEV